MNTFPPSAPVARALLEIGAVGITPDEPVTFKSGIKSPVYVDNRRLIFYPDQWHIVINEFVTRLHGGDLHADAIAGVETSGIPHSSAFAFVANLPSVFVRKQSKEHGLKRRIEGGDVKGMRVVLVEDMVSTGESSLSAVSALRQAGAIVEDCFAIITYGFPDAAAGFNDAGVRLHTLTTFEVVVNEAVRAGQVSTESAIVIHNWLSDPYGWGKR
ncbi:MAG: orotate phosphoribosyltransferase [Chloroflexota bacterium]|nr:orotate phosphoribosyltransferase [Chloroflexota bacterium]